MFRGYLAFREHPPPARWKAKTMKPTKSIGPKERKALAYLDDKVRSTGLIPSRLAICRASEISPRGASTGCRPCRRATINWWARPRAAKRPTRSPAWTGSWTPRGWCRQRPGIARAIGAHRRSLHTMKLFAVRYRAAPLATDPSRRPPCKNPAAAADKAIVYLQETIRTTGRRPSLSEIARYVRAESSTLLCRPGFAAVWQAAVAGYERRPSGDGSHKRYNAAFRRAGHRADQALGDSTGIRPSIAMIARHLKTVPGTLRTRPLFMATLACREDAVKAPAARPAAQRHGGASRRPSARKGPIEGTPARQGHDRPRPWIGRRTLKWSRFEAAYREAPHGPANRPTRRRTRPSRT